LSWTCLHSLRQRLPTAGARGARPHVAMERACRKDTGAATAPVMMHRRRIAATVPFVITIKAAVMGPVTTQQRTAVVRAPFKAVAATVVGEFDDNSHRRSMTR